jgi:hypothetical protein
MSHVLSSRRRRPAATLTLLALAVVAIIAACGGNDSTSPGTPAAVAKVSGDSQTTGVGVATGAPFVARVLNGKNAPIAGVPVTWKITAGGGSLSDTTDTSDVNGEVRTTYTGGTVAGAASVTVSVSDFITRGFTATLTPGPVAALLKFGLDNPAAVKGSAVTLNAKVADQYGNGIEGASVSWAASGGTLSASTGTTPAGGVVTTVLTLGDQPGVYSVTVTTPGAPPLTITITAI